MPILRLNLKGCYFDAIRSGEKTEEYRLAAIWERRLAGRDFEEIHLLRGYPKRGDESRLLRRRWRGYTVREITHPHFGTKPGHVCAIDVSEEVDLHKHDDLFAEVRPTGWLLKRLVNISDPIKIEWNQYLRACKAIPQNSPVAGETSWEKINNRRCSLIENRGTRDEDEFRALQKVAGAVKAPHLVAQNFLLARLLRRLKAQKK